VATSRKDKIKEAMEQFVSGLLEEGETWQGGALGQSGPMPGLFGIVGMAFIKQYYVALTNRRVLFVRSSQLSGRPLRLDFSDPREAARMTAGVEGKFWNLVTYEGSRSVRLRYHQLWREEMAIVMHALKGAST
jgi:hypothetical protein